MRLLDYLPAVALAVIAFIGFRNLGWMPHQVLFFFYLQSLVKVPFLFLSHAKVCGREDRHASLSFIGVYSVIFLVYTFFFLGVIHFSTDRAGKFHEAFLHEFSLLFHRFGLPLMGILLPEVILFLKGTGANAWKGWNSLDILKLSATRLLGILPVLVILTLSLQAGALPAQVLPALIVILIAVYEIFWIRKGRPSA